MSDPLGRTVIALIAIGALSPSNRSNGERPQLDRRTRVMRDTDQNGHSDYCRFSGCCVIICAINKTFFGEPALTILTNVDLYLPDNLRGYFQ
jgi:hypothetical protein